MVLVFWIVSNVLCVYKPKEKPLEHSNGFYFYKLPILSFIPQYTPNASTAHTHHYRSCHKNIMPTKGDTTAPPRKTEQSQARPTPTLHFAFRYSLQMTIWQATPALSKTADRQPTQAWQW
ncbi:hypothetical protein MBO_02225 [Moraxella bovoculi 237]|uniref:Uncharacterized protein n=1 Tax=Moraxella bovoculi 237 TaxID=743974 RepID=A0A066UP77_9GAMM|nr:hypothetical protein MBO_02225 [Moraxella bovoculi 237]